MKIWDKDRWLDSVGEGYVIERHEGVLKQNVTYHPKHTGAIFYDRDLDIDQGIGDEAKVEIKSRRYTTRALREHANKVFQPDATTDDVWIISEHPYPSINDDTCLEHVTFNPWTKRMEIAGICDATQGACDAIIWLDVPTLFDANEIPLKIETILWRCCPEENWPTGARLAARNLVTSYHKTAIYNFNSRPHHNPNQLPLFSDEICKRAISEERQINQSHDSTA